MGRREAQSDRDAKLLNRWIKAIKRNAAGEVLAREVLLEHKPEALEVQSGREKQLLARLVALATRGTSPVLTPLSGKGQFFRVAEASSPTELSSPEVNYDEASWKIFAMAVAPRSMPVTFRDVTGTCLFRRDLDAANTMQLLRLWCACDPPRLVRGEGGFSYTEHGLALRRELRRAEVVRIRRATKLGAMLKTRRFDLFSRFDEVVWYAARLHPVWQAAMFLGHCVDGFSVDELASEFDLDPKEAVRHLNAALRRVDRRIQRIHARERAT